MATLRNKRILITGASSGIGKAFARELARRGAVLAIAARRGDALRALADDIEKAGGVRPIVLTADLSRRGAAEELATQALSELGAVDIVINNAGVGLGGSQENVGDGDAARELFETNFWSPLALTRAFAPRMRNREGCAVVNVTSIGSVIPVKLTGHYGSSKAALASATETLRLELGGTGIHVLHVVPGPIETPMLAEARQIPGATESLARSPRGNVETLARLTANALERRRAAVVYPRFLWSAYLMTGLARMIGRIAGKKIDASDPRVIRGGSTGDPLAANARIAFESGEKLPRPAAAPAPN